MAKQNKKNNQGFTMIELIIVIAVIGIIGAILAPTYSSVTTSARLTTDISTVKTVQQLIDLYYAERGEYPKELNELTKLGYLEKEITLQTDKADIEFKNNKVKLGLPSLIYHEASNKLDEERLSWIIELNK